MKNEDLKNKTTEKLQSELKKMKTITGALVGVLIVLVAVTVYGLTTKEDYTMFIALIAVAISCSAIIPSQLNVMKKIKAELSLRNEN